VAADPKRSVIAEQLTNAGDFIEREGNYAQEFVETSGTMNRRTRTSKRVMRLGQ